MIKQKIEDIQMSAMIYLYTLFHLFLDMTSYYAIFNNDLHLEIFINLFKLVQNTVILLLVNHHCHHNQLALFRKPIMAH